MRVTVTHHELKKGIVFRRVLFDVHIQVQFSEEERYLIEKHGLEDVIVLERDPPPDYNLHEDDDPRMFHLYTEDLMKGVCKYACLDAPSAKGYEHAVLEELKLLKQLLDTYQTDGIEGSTTYEL